MNYNQDSPEIIEGCYLKYKSEAMDNNLLRYMVSSSVYTRILDKPWCILFSEAIGCNSEDLYKVIYEPNTREDAINRIWKNEECAIRIRQMRDRCLNWIKE